MANTILYNVFNGLYLNLTNRCPCACAFCVRNDAGGVGEGNNLWLEHEPDIDEVLAALDGVDFGRYDEAVFCGFGEPCERLDALIAAARYIKEHSRLPVRLNTNGLSDLINRKRTAPTLAGVIDKVSVSLNAPDREEYNKLCRPSFGAEAFDAMIRFALECKELIPDTCLTVVDVIGEEQVEKCRALCEKIGVRLRVRKAY